MTSREYTKTQLNKVSQNIDNVKVQLDWIERIQKQVDFANRPDVLTDFVLDLKIQRRGLED